MRLNKYQNIHLWLNYSFKSAVSDFRENLLKVDQTEHHNTLVANQQFTRDVGGEKVSKREI